jgi:hypothetical protein
LVAEIGAVGALKAFSNIGGSVPKGTWKCRGNFRGNPAHVNWNLIAASIGCARSSIPPLATIKSSRCVDFNFLQKSIAGVLRRSAQAGDTFNLDATYHRRR